LTKRRHSSKTSELSGVGTASILRRRAIIAYFGCGQSLANGQFLSLYRTIGWDSLPFAVRSTRVQEAA
jgi:hypothetical protein